MLKYKEAKKIALQNESSIKYCSEFDIGYTFCTEKAKKSIGGFGAFAILKKNGKVVNNTYFFMQLHPKFIRDIDFESE